MNFPEKYIERCLQLAVQGMANVAPNPMVGCVIVCNDTIIGEGYHQQFGEAHAEVNAINSVKNKKLLKESTLYINLEPCSHFGKTPPCTDLIIKQQIPNVVIGGVDTNALVNGQGIIKLRNAGVKVTTGVLDNKCKELNKRFFTFHEKKRPYIILKWAESKDGYLDGKRNHSDSEKAAQISNNESKKLLHKWRSEEQAIMVGTNTVLLDNPRLTVREIKGKNPLRITIDKFLRVPTNFHFFDKSTPTLIFTSEDKKSEKNIEYVKISFEDNIVPQILDELFRRNIQSLIVEGGEQLLNSFIEFHLWDEARVFVSDTKIRIGIKAPVLKPTPIGQQMIANDKLLFYKNS